VAKKWISRLSEEEQKEILEAVSEALKEIDKIKNRDIKRILRTVAKFCYRIGGRTEYEGFEDLYVVRCVVPDGLKFLTASHTGKGGYAGLYTERDISEFRVPDDWVVTVESGARRVKGFRVAISKSLTEEGVYNIEISPI